MNAVAIERRIILREAEDLGVHPPLLWGRFAGPELIYAFGLMASGKTRCWSREPREDAEAFGLEDRARSSRSALHGRRELCGPERLTVPRTILRCRGG
ncbi:hypothetical protein IYX23_02915 [Methylocystis sp. L43]|uniref:hypothetical protein n=1 Tax=unclassified Methylocystis TaxID=2625913 RepID=UPI0018C29666|nr:MULTISPECIES: hypothetical protein [unclassified Methylocystis]MBG0796648.1 hypothetical protein [Methylocystis sp. L43]MBG0804633.1 hypothetical protein [Methylocystis sp. H15]